MRWGSRGGPQQFSSEAIETGRDDPKTIFPADLDGDGDLVLVSGPDGDGVIAWAENVAGDGLQWTTHTISSNALGVHSVYADDMDGDGDMDVLAATKDDDTIAWFENDPAGGGLWTRNVVSTNVDYPKHAVAADVDGDGDLDVVSASTFDDKIAWFENRAGAGVDWSEHVISTVADAPTWVAVSDVDGDGDLDVATASSIDTTIIWFENTAGDGSVWTGHCLTTASFFARRLVGADIDGDGDVDLLASFTFADSLFWYENVDGVCSVWFEHFVLARVSSVKDIQVGDIDGDGDLDVVSAAFNGNRIDWFENAGGGAAWTQHDTGALVDAPGAIHAGDADGDGDLDIFYATTGNDEIGCLLNDSSPRGHDARVAPGPPPG